VRAFQAVVQETLEDTSLLDACYVHLHDAMQRFWAMMAQKSSD